MYICSFYTYIIVCTCMSVIPKQTGMCILYSSFIVIVSNLHGTYVCIDLNISTNNYTIMDTAYYCAWEYQFNGYFSLNLKLKLKLQTLRLNAVSLGFFGALLERSVSPPLHEVARQSQTGLPSLN